MPKVDGNRDRKTRPKKGYHWCFGCDAYLVRAGEKCKVCGQRSDAGKTRRRKKD